MMFRMQHSRRLHRGGREERGESQDAEMTLARGTSVICVRGLASKAHPSAALRDLRGEYLNIQETTNA